MAPAASRSAAGSLELDRAPRAPTEGSPRPAERALRAFLCILLGGACAAPPSAEPPPSPAEAPEEARTDLAALRRRIPVPPEYGSVRWAARARNAGTAPGLTELEILAWFPLLETIGAEVAPGPGEPGGQGTFKAEPALVAAVLPPGEAAGPGLVAEERGPADAFEKPSWAVRTPGGLAVHLTSR